MMITPTTEYVVFTEYYKMMMLIDKTRKSGKDVSGLEKQAEIYSMLVNQRDCYRFASLENMTLQLSDFGFDDDVIDSKLSNIKRFKLSNWDKDIHYSVWLLEDTENKTYTFKPIAFIRPTVLRKKLLER